MVAGLAASGPIAGAIIHRCGYRKSGWLLGSLLGFFGIVLHIIAYFMALKTTTIAFTMIGFQISIILVAFYEHESEKLDLFKILYLIILIFSIGIIVGIIFIIYEIQKYSKLFQFISPYISPKLNKKCPKIFCIKIKK